MQCLVVSNKCAPIDTSYIILLSRCFEVWHVVHTVQPSQTAQLYGYSLPSICLCRLAKSSSDMWENLQLGPKPQTPNAGAPRKKYQYIQPFDIIPYSWRCVERSMCYLFGETSCRVSWLAHHPEWLQSLQHYEQNVSTPQTSLMPLYVSLNPQVCR